ncbi:DNA polymerase III subunit gamma/tau [Paraburkholderia sp. DHOC27]|uniref:DNA polymerase III subunit gamma/tau n=1 Tax=Paraburkholderia sp. DHOC27 TaxID=2303330 RepID=UPI000E3BE260|nr:DNA polymerase III subunit gamma/tau [Paraburkholderia sp. DHOC27]RFU47807.1 DNA polymerase III subunit gamma/tau [Paraburkholderia sp. DHOC27]
MTYQVLARKWRPKDFASLVGQEHVVRALTHALDGGRLHHAYLFTGTRGVGKTTLSRIFAKALNCETGVTSTPCGVCRACREIDEGRFVDYVEMDAASNRGVDEMAALLERAVYAPVDARFKVYMIDEVHMLTNHAFNAMLKTLEEPPSHVKFILATTDPQKIPVTVLSRCLQFNLKQMPAGHIVSHLERILGEEHVPFDVQALRLLARAADGSMRDALSLTDQAIAYSANQVTDEAVRGMLGALDQSYLIRLLDALADGDGAAVLAVADEMSLRSLSFSTALQDLASLLHRIAWGQFAPASVLDEWPEAVDIRRFADALSAEQVQLFYQIATIGRSELGLAPDEYAGFTMTLLRMLAFEPAPTGGGGGAGSPVRGAGAGGSGGAGKRTGSPAVAALQAAASVRTSEAVPAAPLRAPEASAARAEPSHASESSAAKPARVVSEAALAAPTPTVSATRNDASDEPFESVQNVGTTGGTGASAEGTAAQENAAERPAPDERLAASVAQQSVTGTGASDEASDDKPEESASAALADEVDRENARAEIDAGSRAPITVAQPDERMDPAAATESDPASTLTSPIPPAPAESAAAAAPEVLQAPAAQSAQATARATPATSTPGVAAHGEFADAVPRRAGGASAALDVLRSAGLKVSSDRGRASAVSAAKAAPPKAAAPRVNVPVPTAAPRAAAPTVLGERAQAQARPQAPFQSNAQANAQAPAQRNADRGGSSGPPWDDMPPDDFVPLSAEDDYFGPPDDGYMPVFDAGPDDVRVTSAAPAPAPVDTRPLPPAIPLDALGFNGDWPALAVGLSLKGISYQLAFNSELMALEGTTLKLSVPVPQYAEASQVAKLKVALAERLGHEVGVQVVVGPARRTAAAFDAAARAQRQKEAEHEIGTDPFVQSLIREFGASIVPGSIRPIAADASGNPPSTH